MKQFGLSRKQVAEVFERERVAITQHIGTIFRKKELEKKQYVRNSYLLQKMVKVAKRFL